MWLKWSYLTWLSSENQLQQAFYTHFADLLMTAHSWYNEMLGSDYVMYIISFLNIKFSAPFGAVPIFVFLTFGNQKFSWVLLMFIKCPHRKHRLKNFFLALVEVDDVNVHPLLLLAVDLAMNLTTLILQDFSNLWKAWKENQQIIHSWDV